MESNKSLDESKIIAALICDVQYAHGLVFNTRARNLTIKKVESRIRKEGLGFLTKTLPRLGKAFDKAIAGDTKLNCKTVGFKPYGDTQLPRFLGELFSQVLLPDGGLLPHPCAQCVKDIREILYSFYKYELPYTDEQEQHVIQKFKRTEEDLSTLSANLQEIEDRTATAIGTRRRVGLQNLLARDGEIPLRDRQVTIAREAKILLSRLFSSFDPLNIKPRHGPGAVATKQRLGDKYLWSNISGRITKQWPLDAFYFASNGHVCDRYDTFNSITDTDLPARVVLVPKDSRGPRLISCEPVDFQWIQQGLSRAIVELVEGHELTKFNVHFTDQLPNRFGALLGSSTGRYATLDLNEASDRVSVDLVRLIFPEHIFVFLEAARSLSTELPDGEVLPLNKYAPMGSALCFPVLALTVWAILTAAAPDADTRDGILVYGDDVIVPTAYAANAMEYLESFGLKVNRDKSCTSGLFRESCGQDAFQGTCVTPVRFRTVWSSARRPDVYSSWIAYANSHYDKQHYRVYDCIVNSLFAVYGKIPSDDMHLACPSLRWVPEHLKPNIKRWNASLQKVQYKVYDVKSPSVKHVIDGWSMLLRYFVEVGYDRPLQSPDEVSARIDDPLKVIPAFSVSTYTNRKTSMLVKRWR